MTEAIVADPIIGSGAAAPVLAVRGPGHTFEAGVAPVHALRGFDLDGRVVG